MLRSHRIGIFAAMLCGTLFTSVDALAQSGGRPLQEPIRRGDQLIFPEGWNIPKSMTETERRYLVEFPNAMSPRAVTPPPTGPIHCVAEYEPMEGLCMAWENFTPVLTEMSKWVTTTAGGRVFMMFDSAAEQTTGMNTMAAGGVDMGKVVPMVVTTDTVWIRDYGPRYVYEGNCRAVVDHTYNRPRPNDDVQPAYFAGQKKHAFYEHQLVHGGGNYHLNGPAGPTPPGGRKSFATLLIANENPSLTQSQIINIWQNYQNVQTTITAAFPTSVDSTQHIDMWMQICGDNHVIISDWPNNPGSTQDNICDNMAATMTSQGWNVYRTPAFSISGVHYTYTNMVVFNNIIMVPTYTNATVQPHNTAALNTLQAANPGKTIIGVNAQSVITSAGAIHCIVMHVPQHKGGLNPTVYLKNYRGGETLAHGQQIQLKWISDDDNGVSNVDILLSTDGGQTYPITLASMMPDLGTFNWTVPSNINTSQGRFRVRARDAQGFLGHDSSTSDIIIGNPLPPCPADINGDSVVNVSDLLAVINAWGACAGCAADVNSDGVVNVSDLLAVINAWGPC